ncbi:uncharacterized protein LOC108052755 isoform X2 [Drosophila rhopaloa]|uniref:Uncharacterized protein n=1 Tax=Drosophila rhopaloa TaxID=1041015 RepID=A0ABM5J2S7_DRORH|nr:uncharacterized protein LOC108052755 isoform X2 [Drosophila rhopaloa]
MSENRKDDSQQGAGSNQETAEVAGSVSNSSVGAASNSSSSSVSSVSIDDVPSQLRELSANGR